MNEEQKTQNFKRQTGHYFLIQRLDITSSYVRNKNFVSNLFLSTNTRISRVYRTWCLMHFSADVTVTLLTTDVPTPINYNESHSHQPGAGRDKPRVRTMKMKQNGDDSLY